MKSLAGLEYVLKKAQVSMLFIPSFAYAERSKSVFFHYRIGRHMPAGM